MSLYFEGHRALNETLYRALLRARLSEEDIAARLDVDPKTVRRWLEGRTPYRRHRWALASMLGLGENDLWPQVRAARPWPAEIRRMYLRLDTVPPEVWQGLFRSAGEIGILDDSGLLLAEDPAIMTALRRRARAGTRLRICLCDPNTCAPSKVAAQVQEALACYGHLRESGNVEIRLHSVSLTNSIFRADDNVLISQHVFGVPVQRFPVIHLRRTDSSDLFTTYLQSFEDAWDTARPCEETGDCKQRGRSRLQG